MLRESDVDTESLMTEWVNHIQCDDDCFEGMRKLVKDYVAYCQYGHEESARKQICKNQFEQLKSKLHDNTLREYTSFEFIEKLCWQEYLSNK